MNEILTEIWIQSIIIGNYIDHAKHAPLIVGVSIGILLIAISLIINEKRNP